MLPNTILHLPRSSNNKEIAFPGWYFFLPRFFVVPPGIIDMVIEMKPRGSIHVFSSLLSSNQITIRCYIIWVSKSSLYGEAIQ